MSPGMPSQLTHHYPLEKPLYSHLKMLLAINCFWGEMFTKFGWFKSFFAVFVVLSSLAFANGCDVYCDSCDTCTGNLSSAQHVCLSTNLSINGSTCVTVGANNSVFDCAGYSITGNDTSLKKGVYVDDVDNITVSNCVVSDFDFGIYLSTSDNSTVYNNTILSSGGSVGNSVGIQLYVSNYNNVSGNTISFCGTTGIEVYQCVGCGNNITDNVITSNGNAGIELVMTLAADYISDNVVCNHTVDIKDTMASAGVGENKCDSSTVPGVTCSTLCYFCGNLSHAAGFSWSNDYWIAQDNLTDNNEGAEDIDKFWMHNDTDYYYWKVTAVSAGDRNATVFCDVDGSGQTNLTSCTEHDLMFQANNSETLYVFACNATGDWSPVESYSNNASDTYVGNDGTCMEFRIPFDPGDTPTSSFNVTLKLGVDSDYTPDHHGGTNPQGYSAEYNPQEGGPSNPVPEFPFGALLPLLLGAGALYLFKKR